MAKEPVFAIHLEHLGGYEFKVKFDWDRAADMVMDEPAPLGEQKGPNASRVLAAAVANCLSASLMYCVSKYETPPGAVNTTANCTMVRNEKGRLRVGDIDVRITVGDEITQSPRLERCLKLFEDFCVVTASIREGISVAVEVADNAGNVLHKGS